jgi:biofilm protein TabA
LIIGYLDAQENQIKKQNNSYFNEALEIIKRVDFSSKEDGTYDLKGNDLFYHLMTYKTKEKIEQTFPEVHKKYIDFYYILGGKETVGYAPNINSYMFSSDYDSSKDIEFVKDVASENFFTIQKGMFVIFFPGEVHRPGLMAGESLIIRKLIFKVLLS